MILSQEQKSKTMALLSSIGSPNQMLMHAARAAATRPLCMAARARRALARVNSLGLGPFPLKKNDNCAA